MFVQNHDDLIVLLCVPNKIHYYFPHATNYVDLCKTSFHMSLSVRKPVEVQAPVSAPCLHSNDWCTLTVLPFLVPIRSPKSLDYVTFFRPLSFYQISLDNAGEPVEIDGDGEVQGLKKCEYFLHY